MTDSTPSADRQTQSSQENDPAHIVAPIDIARARHASIHGTSVLDKTRRVSIPSSKKPSASSKNKTADSAPSTTPNLSQGGFNLLDGSGNSCLWLFLLGIAFLVGGVLGGIVGGGLLLWVVNTEELAGRSNLPTSTPIFTPTPAPAATLTPTPTPEPINTPSVEDIIAQIIPSVVTVINQQNTFSLNPEDNRVVGSGVIIDNRGYIATNYHVIDNTGELRIILADGREVIGQLIASDPSEDLAIIKINVEGLPTIIWGDSSTLRPGQTVYAIGSPLGDFPSSVSLGVISGLNRALEMNTHVIDGLIQTDAAINRGSSGGPLINTHGEMIGINTFIIRESEERGVAEGIAFAIPANTAKGLLIPWIAAHRGETVPIPASGEPGN